MIGNRYGSLRAVGIQVFKRYMVTGPDDGKPESQKRMDDPLLLGILGKFHSDDDLCQPCIDDLVIGKCVFSERFDVEADR